MQRSVWEECLHVQKPWGRKMCGMFWRRERRLECLESGQHRCGVGEGDQRAGKRPDHEGFIMTCNSKKFGGLLNPVGSH